jgi:hypothetical protein
VVKLMVDYYPPLLRAIQELEPNAPGEARRAIYERARTSLIAHLRSKQPRLTESQIVRERLALEEAVRRVEGEAAAPTLDLARSTRSSSPQSVGADPLAELARLIGQTDPSGVTGHLESPSAVHPLHRYVEIPEPPGAYDANDEMPSAGAPPKMPRFREAEVTIEDETERGDSPPIIDPRDIEATLRGRSPVPPINVIPEQDLTTAIGFSPTRKGPLDLVRDPPTDPYDSEQSQLYVRIRSQLKKLKENIPSQERSQVNDAIDDFLNHPDDWSKVEYKKLVWLSGNSLRTLLAQHEAVKNDPEHYSKLPPSVAEALRNPVQAWSVFVQGDRELARLDYYSLGPREQQQVRENLKSAERVVSIASHDRRIVTEKAAEAIDSMMKSASVESMDVSTKLTQELTDRTFRNFISQIIRQAYLAKDEIANDPQAAKALRGNFTGGAAFAAGSAVVAGVLAATHHAIPFLEFVATNLPVIKEYIVVAFQNSQLIEIVDALEFEYGRLKRLIDEARLPG